MIIQNVIDPRIHFSQQDVLSDWINSYSSVVINNFDEISYNSFKEKIDILIKKNFDIIPIVIDTYGGEIYSLLGIIDILERLEKDGKIIITLSSCKSMSAGGVLAAFGTSGYRYISPSSTIMLHQSSGGYIGKVAEGENMVRQFRKLNDTIFNKLDKKCSKPKDFFKKALKDKENSEWFLSPKEAVKHGLCDHVGIPKISLNLGFDICVE